MGLVSRWILGSPKAPGQIDGMYVDIAAPSLCGLSVGEGRGAVEHWFGPPRSWLQARKGLLDYGHLGLQVRLGAGGLAGFYVFVTQGPNDPWTPFSGSWRPGKLAKPPTRDGFCDVLGDPKRRDEDETFVSLFWERRALINADFSLEGELQALWVDFDDSL